MPSGLQVFNDSGTIQIDSQWSNYALVEKLTVSSAVNPPTNTPIFGFGYRYSAGADDDLVFVHCGSDFNLVGFTYQNGLRYLPVAVYAAGIAITFFRFRRQPPLPSQYGMQVFDGAGGLCFDAASNFARIALAIPGAYSSLLADNFYNIFPNGQYAVLAPAFTGQMVESYSGAGTGGMGWYYIDLYGPRLRCVSGGVRTTGGAYFARSQIPVQNPSGGIRVTQYQSGDLVVADITGF